MLRHFIFASALLSCLVPMAAAEEPIPIEQEPRHRLVFQNEHVRYFDVDIRLK